MIHFQGITILQNLFNFNKKNMKERLFFLYEQAPIYTSILCFWILLGIIILPILLKIKPPGYGRHNSNTKIAISNKVGWILMELPTITLMPLFFLLGTNKLDIVIILFLGLYLIHYINRTLIFPFRIKTNKKKIPLQIVILAFIFNLFNTFLIGYYFGNISPAYGFNWFSSSYFIIGFTLFMLGLIINWQSDSILINLRKKGESGYKIPFGGMFKYISCPNHFGEILEWIGFAILTWSLASFAFALWTVANLLPRSIAHHKWYKQKFKEYPKERKAIFPFIL